MAKHKGRNIRKAKVKRHSNKMLKDERKNMSKRIASVCPENSKSLNNNLGKYYSNLDDGFKGAFNELINQMESGEIYERKIVKESTV